MDVYIMSIRVFGVEAYFELVQNQKIDIIIRKKSNLENDQW